jgi:hypothetical protein
MRVLDLSVPAEREGGRILDVRQPYQDLVKGVVTHRVLRRTSSGYPGDGSPVDQVPPLPSTLTIAVIVLQLRVVTGTPKSRSNAPR